MDFILSRFEIVTNIFKSKEITLKEAALLSGYSSDYIGNLIRTGKISGHRLVGTSAWVTTEAAIFTYLQNLQKNKIGRILPRHNHFLTRIQNDKTRFSFSNFIPSTPLPLLIVEIVSVVIMLGTLLGVFYAFYVYSAIRDKVGETSSVNQPIKR